MSLYTQHRYAASFYLPPIYSPQQQFPLYSLITPQTWSATHSYLDPPLVSLVFSCPLCEESCVVDTDTLKDKELCLISKTDTSTACYRKTDLLVLRWALNLIGR